MEKAGSAESFGLMKSGPLSKAEQKEHCAMALAKTLSQLKDVWNTSEDQLGGWHTTVVAEPSCAARNLGVNFGRLL